jgi:hypothetical protein
MKIGEILVNEGVITPEQLEEAVELHFAHGIKLGSCLIKLGYVEEEKLLQFLSEKLYTPRISPDELVKTSKLTIGSLSSEMAVKHRVIPFRLEGKHLSIAMSDPSDLPAIDEIAFVTGLKVKPYIVSDYLIARFLARFYNHHEMDAHYRYINKSAPDTTDTVHMPTRLESMDSHNASVAAEFECPVDMARNPEVSAETGKKNKTAESNADVKRVFNALLNVLESKGLVTRQEVIDMLSR